MGSSFCKDNLFLGDNMANYGVSGPVVPKYFLVNDGSIKFSVDLVRKKVDPRATLSESRSDFLQ